MDITKLPLELRRVIYDYCDRASLRLLSLASRNFYHEITLLRFETEYPKLVREWAYSGNTFMIENFAGRLRPLCIFVDLPRVMCVAAANGNRPFLELLNNNLAAYRWGFQPCLNSAVRHSQRDVVQYLLEQGADPEEPWDEWPIALATDAATRQMLVEKGGEHTLKYEMERAIEAKSLDDIRILSEHRLFKTGEAQRSLGQTSVAIAATYKNPDVIEYLLSIGCPTDAKSFVTAICDKEFKTAVALKCDPVLNCFPNARCHEGFIVHESCIQQLEIIENFIAWKEKNIKLDIRHKNLVHFHNFSCCLHRKARRSSRLMASWTCQACCKHQGKRKRSEGDIRNPCGR